MLEDLLEPKTLRLWTVLKIVQGTMQCYMTKINTVTVEVNKNNQGNQHGCYLSDIEIDMLLCFASTNAPFETKFNESNNGAVTGQQGSIVYTEFWRHLESLDSKLFHNYGILGELLMFFEPVSYVTGFW